MSEEIRYALLASAIGAAAVFIVMVLLILGVHLLRVTNRSKEDEETAGQNQVDARRGSQGMVDPAIVAAIAVALCDTGTVARVLPVRRGSSSPWRQGGVL